jgi:hypothetical protein
VFSAVLLTLPHIAGEDASNGSGGVKKPCVYCRVDFKSTLQYATPF